MSLLPTRVLFFFLTQKRRLAAQPRLARRKSCRPAARPRHTRPPSRVQEQGGPTVALAAAASGPGIAAAGRLAALGAPPALGALPTLGALGALGLLGRGELSVSDEAGDFPEGLVHVRARLETWGGWDF